MIVYNNNYYKILKIDFDYYDEILSLFYFDSIY